jgi:LysR family transcriptional regulator, benzoate and cis,cis-muconate-responsive activator of ben and cat genes
MEFKQLEMFVAVAEERGVQRAAARVFRTQPAVSMAIAKLEEEVGVTLFFRRERFRLTAAGQTLYDYARAILKLRRDANAALRFGNEERASSDA